MVDCEPINTACPTLPNTAQRRVKKEYTTLKPVPSKRLGIDPDGGEGQAVGRPILEEKIMPMQKPSEQAWLKEYEAYRSELLVMTKERYSILAIVVTAIGIAFGFASGANGEWVVFLIPLIGLVVILPFAYLTFSISEHYHRITAYLEVFVEPNLGLNRELAWNIHYKEFHHVAFSKPIMIIYALLVFASSFFPLAYYLAKTVSGIAQAFTQYEIIIVATEALVGLIIGIFVWRSWGSIVTKSDAKARWEKVKQLMSIEKMSSKSNANKRTHLRSAA